MADPRRVFEEKDMAGAVLYAKRVSSDLADAYPILVDAAGNLCVNMTVGTVSLSSTESTINNAVGNPVNVSLTQTVISVTLPPALTTTAVTVSNASGNPVQISGNVNIATATLGTVTVSLTSTKVTVESTGLNVTLTSTAVTVANTAGTVTNSVSTLMLMSKTLTGSTGSVSATWTSIFTPTARAKIFAFSFTTTSASEVTVLLCDGVFANSKELWRATLMAPAGANSGANLAVSPPGFLFGSRSTSAVTISLSTAVLVHYSMSLYDEA